MTGLPSIRGRLSIALIAVSIAWTLAVSAAVWSVVRHEVDELLDHALQESAEILHGLLSFNITELLTNGVGALPASKQNERLFWQIVAPDQVVVLRSHAAPVQAWAVGRIQGFATVDDQWRVFSAPIGQDGQVLHVAQHLSERNEARLEAGFFSAGAALLVGLASALWLRSRIGAELKPLSDLSTAVAHFDPLRPDAILVDVDRAELVPMHDAIKDLGTRLVKRVANERAFSAHAAHALRTPLAGLVTQLALAQRESPPETWPRLRRARDAADHLKHVVTAILTLFRTGNTVICQSVDVGSLASSLPFEGLTIVAEHPVQVWADPDLLAAALLNLFDNAVRHGATIVTISMRTDRDHVHIVSADNGDGIPEPERLRLQEALDSQNYEAQTGLGLMLVDLVARAHDGATQLVAAQSGCTVEITLACDPGAGKPSTKP